MGNAWSTKMFEPSVVGFFEQQYVYDGLCHKQLGI